MALKKVKEGPYHVMMIDPPWPVNFTATPGCKYFPAGRTKDDLAYQPLQVSEIFGLLDSQILPQAVYKHVIFMWTLDKYLIRTDSAMSKRGYKRHTRIIWNKQKGFCPAWTLQQVHEYLVWYFKPTFRKIHEDQKGRWSSILHERSRSHSQKPEIAYQMIEALYPNEKKLDVFSRQKRKGWDQFGDQCDHFPEKGESP